MMQRLSMHVPGAKGKKADPAAPLPPGGKVSGGPRGRASRAGFTLIELMIVVAIIAILASIAYPAYLRYAVKAHRVAAESCLSNYANYMQRYYTTNLRYDQDSSGNAVALPQLDCQKQTSENYAYSFQGAPTTSAFTLQAVPQGAQQSRDTDCATLTINQANQRGISGTGTVDECWNR